MWLLELEGLCSPHGKGCPCSRGSETRAGPQRAKVNTSYCPAGMDTFGPPVDQQTVPCLCSGRSPEPQGQARSYVASGTGSPGCLCQGHGTCSSTLDSFSPCLHTTLGTPTSQSTARSARLSVPPVRPSQGGRESRATGLNKFVLRGPYTTFISTTPYHTTFHRVPYSSPKTPFSIIPSTNISWEPFTWEA
jgi:hypothetical protein